MKRLLSAITACVCGLSLIGCPVNPATGERQLILISEAGEVRLGRRVAGQVEASIGLVNDPQLQEYVSDIGHRLAAVTERPNLPWSFKVVEDPVVNAFALPGGFIYVTRGILAHFNSEAELAGVLGHEIGHVTGRHSAEQLSRAQATQLGLGVGSIFAPEIIAYGDFIGLGLNLAFLKFSRDDERQADDLGVRYMTREHYDARELTGVFTTLERVGEAAGGSSLPSWLSTHPDPGERRQRIGRAIAAAGAPPGGTVAREAYLEQIDGLVYGENPRDGFFRENLFLHPNLEFQMTFPAGWRYRNMARAVLGGSPRQDALIQLTPKQARSPEEAYREFASEQGVQTGRLTRDRVNGLEAVVAEFTASTQQETIRGLAYFISQGRLVYQLMGYSREGNYGAYESVLRRSMDSFGPLTDREALAARPARIRIVKIDQAMTLEEFARRYPSTIPISTLALLNGVEEGANFPAGTTLKRVEGPEGAKN